MTFNQVAKFTVPLHIDLNGVDMRDIRTRVLELLAYRRRVAMYQESEKKTYQWKKPERLRR
ncbi:TPA: hypothetical protein RHV80_003503 [Escherichia coli]|nr:hypothetical protein [Escherichia coli]